MLAKRAVVATLAPGTRRTVIPHVLALVYIPNYHGVMGLFGDRLVVLIALALTVVAVLFALLRDTLRHCALAQLGFGMILGGAAGNVIDRFVHGFVVDFIAIRNFCVFNLADACIDAGLVLVAVGAWHAPRERAMKGSR